MFEPGYIGGKGSVGTFSRIIGEMPFHSVYVEPFFGSGAVFWNKARSAKSILIDRAAAAVAKVGVIAGCDAICGDALEILPTLDLPPDALIYCDPPYVLSTRKNRLYYDFEMTDRDHMRLLAIAREMPCRVMISGYDNELYRSSLHGWRVCSFKARTRGHTATEFLWMNFAEPEELHDWRFAGLSHRERYNLKRFVARFTARVEGMPPRKRGFIRRELAAAFAAGGVARRCLTPAEAIPGTIATGGAERSDIAAHGVAGHVIE